MDHVSKALAFLTQRNEKKERLSNFCNNGSLLLEELIASFGGRYKLPLRSFSAEEIIRASNNFSEKVHHLSDSGYIYRGNLERRPVLVKAYAGFGISYPNDERILNEAIRDVAINSQMSLHKNVLKLVGYSLEFKYPAMVYEDAGTKLLPQQLFQLTDDRLSWRCRIKIESDLPNVVLYLHTAFATPIIYRDLTVSKVIIDKSGVAKLFDFTASITLPSGESQVEDPELKGTLGYLDPQYFISGCVISQKTDVYSFGMLMLVLFTGERATGKYDEKTGELMHIADTVKDALRMINLTEFWIPPFLKGKEMMSQGKIC